MFYNVSAECILANVLKKHNVPIGYLELGKVRKYIYKELISSSLYIDISDDSISSAVENNPRLFSWHDEKISRAANSEEYYTDTYFKKCINYNLPPMIRNAIEKNCINIQND